MIAYPRVAYRHVLGSGVGLRADHIMGAFQAIRNWATDPAGSLAELRVSRIGRQYRKEMCSSTLYENESFGLPRG
jgi:hypothetical protein